MSENVWKESLIDAAVVNWVLSSENADDPKKMIYDLMACVVREALDPAISKDALRLIREGIVIGLMMANKKLTPSAEAERKIEDLLGVLAEMDPADYRTALEEMQSRATSALEALDEDEREPEENGDDRDEDE